MTWNFPLQPLRSLSILLTLLVSIPSDAAAQDTAFDPEAEYDTEQAEATADAEAADQDDDYSGIEEIVVSITKRKENVQDVPGAITGLSATLISEANIQSSGDLVTLIPNAVVKGQGGPISIRGISQSFSSQSPIAQHVNGVFRFNGDAFAGMYYDLAGIDVARGPQGTVYGRNATSGAINLMWRRPHDQVDAFGDVTFGNYERIGFRGGLNWPILGEGDERLMGRFAFQRRTHDGYLDNLEEPDSSKDPGSEDLKHFRASFRSKPSDKLLIDVRSFWTETRGGGGSSRPFSAFPTAGLILASLGGSPLELLTVPYTDAKPIPTDIREVRSRAFTKGSSELKYWGVDADIRYELDDVPGLGDLELVALGGAEWRHTTGVSDADGSELFLLDTKDTDDTVAGTFDLRALTSDADHLNWIVGFFYYHHTLSRFRETFSTLNVPAFGLVDQEFFIDSTRDATSSGFAPYVNVNITPTGGDGIEIFGGFRWNQDEVKVVAHNFASRPLPFIGESTLSGSATYGEPTGEIGLKSEWTPGKIAYLKFSRGYKAGNIELLANGTTNAVQPESILAVEGGTKNRLFDNTLHLNLTGFYYDYTDLQVPLIQGLNVITENAADASIWGLELEAIANPIGDLYVNMTLSYLNAEFGEFCINDAAQPRSLSDPGCAPPTNAINGQLNLEGNVPEDSPSWKITLLTNYEFDLGKYGTLTPILKFTFTDEYYLRPFNCGACGGVVTEPPASLIVVDATNGFASPEGIDHQPWFTQTDIRLHWRSQNNQFFAEAFIQNIEDNSVYQRVIVGSQINGAIGGRMGFHTPRIYGARFGISFEGV